MIAFVIRRIGQSLAVMLTVGFIAFALFNYIGDPLASMVGQDTSAVERAQLRHQLGLDDPFVVQFGRFLGRAVQGNFGISYQYARPVQQLLAERLPATLELAAVASLLALSIGMPMGVYTGLHRDTWASRLIMAVSLIGVSLPTFLTASS